MLSTLRATVGHPLTPVAVGGALGATGRYGLSLAVATPAGTLLANLVGAFLLGGFTADVPALSGVSERVRLTFATGFLSSFTTYGTFAVEVASAAPTLAVGYVAATYALGIGAAAVGRGLASTVAEEVVA